MRSDLPSGTVTFLFTDVEGSTRLLHELGAEAYGEALAEHRRVIRQACNVQGGVEVDTQGDAFFFAFPTAPGALAAASTFTRELGSGTIQVRVGLHTGTPLLTEEGYVGADVHRAARIGAAGHGGQVLASAATATLAHADGLRDLGEHRLKDLSAPERIYQLGVTDFPPLKTLYRTNLPVTATPFLGRERELAEIVELLTEGGLRLLTLTGPGGTGKTRLALQAAAEAAESFRDGVYWVPLAPLRDPDLVLPSLAQTLSVTEEPEKPLEDTLAAHLSGKRVLVLLDNAEHLLPLAAQRIAALRASNGSLVLVTSRERLRVGGEHAWPVPPLDESDGTALFVVRARAINPSFAHTPAVDELCARLDELPLAIELAAARTAVFSAEQLLERISQRLDLLKGDRDVDSRQETLRATIEWSHELLDAEEKRLFARLAVFVGGCTYEAAEEVVSADPDTLQSLLDKSLVRRRDSKLGTRYWMLETIREFATERLDASGEAEDIRRRHAEWLLALAEGAEPHLRHDSRGWADRLELEHDNLRAALDLLEATHEHELSLKLAGALSRFWYLRGHLAEGRRRLESALRFDSDAETRAKALIGASVMTMNLGDTDAAEAHAREALALERELGDAWGIAYSEMMVGNALGEGGDVAGARPRLEESLRLFRELGDEHYVTVALTNLAWVTEELGDVERARELNEENLRRARAMGSKRLEAFALAQLGMCARDQGRSDEAASMLKESIVICRIDDDRLELAYNLARLSAVFSDQSHASVATQLLARSETLADELGVADPWWNTRRNEATIAALRSQLDEEAFEQAWDEGRKLTLDEAVAVALGDSVDEGDKPVADA